MLHKDDFEHIGSVSRSHGIHGEIGLKLTVDIAPLMDEDERLFLMLEHDGLLVPYAVESLRSKAGDIDLVHFSGIESREEADALTGLSVWLDKDYLDAQSEETDPYDWERYVGYTVLDADSQKTIGRISEVDTSTLNAFICVDRDADGELLLPIAEALLASVVPEDRTIALFIPLGLLHDEDSLYDIHE